MRSVVWGLLAAGAVMAAPTFHKDVLPVLQNNCQGCHRPGEAAPMSLLNYESARPWAKSIKEAVVSRRMPSGMLRLSPNARKIWSASW